MRRPVLLFLLLLILSSSIFAAGKIYWQENGVLVTGIDGMGIGDLVTDMKGGAIIITGDLDSVYAIRIDKDGNLPWGIKGKTVDTTTQGSFQRYTIGCSDGQGGAIILWSRFFPWGYELYCQKIDSNGNKLWGNDAIKVTLSDSSQHSHVIASDGAGGAIMAWQQFQMLQHDIYAQRIDSTGIRRWGDYGVAVCSADSTQQNIGLICDNTGNSVIVWEDLRNGEYDVYSQRLNNNGLPVWQVNGVAVCDTDSTQSISGAGYSIIIATDANVIITWNDKRNGNWDVYAQKLHSSDGMALWVAQGIPVCDTIYLQGGGPIIGDDKGGAILFWLDQRNGFNNIFAQRLNSDGQKLWDNQGIPVCESDSATGHQRVVSDGQSGAIICWQDNRAGKNETDIYSQHIDSSGNIKWQINGMAICTANAMQERPHIVQSDSGTAIIAWPDYRDNYARAYVQRVGDDPNGVEWNSEDRIQKPECRIYQNAPNPFSSNTYIRYSISESGNIRINVYNINGQLVRVLESGFKEPGNYIAKWDGQDENRVLVASGVYFYQLRINDRQITQKLTIIK